MVDIRQRVDEDRGILKKIQNFVPGFRGYRRREDLRDADRMLRGQIAGHLASVRKDLENSRMLITGGWDSKELELIGGLISQFKKVERQVAHAETGYSGFVADIEVKEDQIFRLYDYDASMIDLIGQMRSAVGSIQASLSSGDGTRAAQDLMALRTLISDFESQFERRLRVITGTEV